MNQIEHAISILKEKLILWWDSLILSVPNIILVFLTLIVGLRIIEWGKKLTFRFAQKFTDNLSLRSLIQNVTSVILYIGLFILILAILGLYKTIAGILASAGVAGLAIGLALQDPLMNLFSGVIMSTRSSLKTGDFIESNGYTGSVASITLSTTTIRQLTGEEVIIPNKQLIQNPIKNFSTNGLRRIDIESGVSYGDDLHKVQKIAEKAVLNLSYEHVPRPVEFIYTEFADSSINFQLRIWTNPPDMWTYLQKKSNAIIQLKEAFDKENVSIPFPIRTLEFDPKGGENLREVLIG